MSPLHNLAPDMSFDDIAPYSDADFHEKMLSLVKEPGFEYAVRYAMPDVDYPAFVQQLLTIRTQNDFQTQIMWPFLETLATKTTCGVSAGGLNNIDLSTAYTYITNHRDIVLDASFLNLLLLRDGIPTTEIAIGNNLLIYHWIEDLVKLNKSFIVKRDVRRIEALKAAAQLSGYIHYAVNTKHSSVWIAQREGRAKDSNDLTQESLVKMFGLAGGESVQENLADINLLPASISYEYDPNDYLKAREFLLRSRDPQFHKSQHDDLLAMETGMLQPKGRVHIEFGKPIRSIIEGMRPADKNELVKMVCGVIDNEIHRGYRIYPINYIAFDRLYKCRRFSDMYTQSDEETAEAYFESRLELARESVGDVTADETEYMRSTILAMYSNPLKNKLRAK